MFVRNRGYKVFRIVGNVEIPDNEQIKDCISMLVNSDKYFIKIKTDIE